MALFCNQNNIIYFDSFDVEHIPEEMKKFIDRHSSSASQNENIISNIFGIQANNSVMCGYFCIGFIDFIIAGKKLTGYTSLFSPYDLKRKR